MKLSALSISAFLSFSMLFSCQSSEENQFHPELTKKQIEVTLERLLTAIEEKNIESLKSTMSPSGKMELVLPSTETTYTVDEFVNFHTEWFKDTTWTMETKILHINPGQYIGAVSTEAMYREPDRNGKPYFNLMNVSYVLERSNDGNWYVIKDHASSLKKSTD